jgi:eukaryotic-like serine/threonine-protein kinase
MLTGKRAAQERTAIAPPTLERVVHTCLEKDPDERWQSARDVKVGLELVEVGQAISSPAISNPWRERAGWIVAAAAVLGALLFVALWRGRAPAAGDVFSFTIYPPETTAFSAALNTTVVVPQFALAPDGHSIVFTAGAPGARPMLWLRPMEQAGARALLGTEDALHPFWSPDSRWIGFFAEGKLKKIRALGGAVQVVTQAGTDVRGGTWGPDDTIVFASGTGPLSRVASAGGTATPASILAQGNLRFPRFLPDGRHFLSVAFSSERAASTPAPSMTRATSLSCAPTRAPSMRRPDICYS